MSESGKRIKILLHGESYHAKVFSEQLNRFNSGIIEAEFYGTLTNKINYAGFDIFHLISSPLPVLRRLVKYKKSLIYHWIGTDVYRFSNDFFFKKIIKKILINSVGAFNLVVNETLKKELKQLGISSKVLPLVNLNLVKNIPPLPEKFSILTYIPKNRWDFYNGDLVMSLAKEFPDIDFLILAAEEINHKPENVFTYNFIDDVTELYNKVNALLRITTHDGLSKMVLEALSFGRHVLWSEPFPHCIFVKNLDDCKKAINMLKEDPSVNEEGKTFVELNFNQSKICGDYLSICKKLF
ncbi:MAG: hypothetical protein V3V72_01510 [Ignavibacteriaceae bacterium]